MADDTSPVPLDGSIPPPQVDASPAGSIDPSSDVEVTVYLRPRRDRVNATHPRAQGFLTREELAATRGAAPDDLSRLENFARSHALSIIEVDPAGRRLRLW